MTRRTAREITLCLLFDFTFHPQEDPKEVLDLYLKSFPDPDTGVKPDDVRADPFITSAYLGILKDLPRIDGMIEGASQNWKPERISRVSRSILRLAVYELLSIEDIPYKVTINEAIELAKTFDHDNGYTFINGILGNVVKQLSEGAGDAPQEN